MQLRYKNRFVLLIKNKKSDFYYNRHHVVIEFFKILYVKDRL